VTGIEVSAVAAALSIATRRSSEPTLYLIVKLPFG
jgi:hypothetical protein